MKNLFKVEGRLNRRSFALGLCILASITYLLLLSSMYVRDLYPQEEADLFASIVIAIIYFTSLFLVPSFMVRRFHDLNKSGWMILSYYTPLIFVMLIPYAGPQIAILLFVLLGPVLLCFIPGTKGYNEYGEDQGFSLNLSTLKKIFLP